VRVELPVPASAKTQHTDHDLVACRRESALPNEALKLRVWSLRSGKREPLHFHSQTAVAPVDGGKIKVVADSERVDQASRLASRPADWAALDTILEVGHRRIARWLALDPSIRWMGENANVRVGAGEFPCRPDDVIPLERSFIPNGARWTLCFASGQPTQRRTLECSFGITRFGRRFVQPRPLIDNTAAVGGSAWVGCRLPSFR
jgi:hypothetical protein